jgi:probable HAF family extracellular repeat protein
MNGARTWLRPLAPRLAACGVLAAMVILAAGARAGRADARSSDASPVASAPYQAIALPTNFAVKGDWQSVLNDAGQVAGMIVTPDLDAPDGWSTEAALWSPSTGVVPLGTLGGQRSSAVAINASGIVIGDFENESGYGSHAFVWTQASGMVDLGHLGSDTGWTDTRAVNASGMITGLSNDRAFVWTAASGMRDIGTLPDAQTFDYVPLLLTDAGMVVGAYQQASGQTGLFAWTQAAGIVSLGSFGGRSSAVNAVNASGMVVGWSGLPDWAHHAFVWTRARGLLDITPPGNTWDHAFDVNASGTVVGENWTWTASGGRVSTAPYAPFAINDAGTIVGTGPAANGSTAFTWTTSGDHAALPVPALPAGCSITGEFPLAISASGLILGRYTGSGGPACDEHVVLWVPTSPQSVQPGGAAPTTPAAVALRTGTSARFASSAHRRVWASARVRVTGGQPTGPLAGTCSLQRFWSGHWHTLLRTREPLSGKATCSLSAQLAATGRFRMRVAFTPTSAKRFRPSASSLVWVVVPV